MNRTNRKLLTETINSIKVNDFVEVEDKQELKALSEANVIKTEDKSTLMSVPNKYLKDGAYQSISTNFTKDENENYIASQKLFNVFAPNTFTREHCISCAEGNYTINIYRLSNEALMIKTPSGDIIKEKVDYINEDEEEKLQVVSNVEGVEANIIATNVNENNEYLYQFVLSNLVMEVVGSDILFKDSLTGDNIYVLRNIFAYDKNINIFDGVNYSLTPDTTNTSIYNLSVTLNDLDLSTIDEYLPITIPLKIEKVKEQLIEIVNFNNSMIVPSYNGENFIGIKDKSTYKLRFKISLEEVLDEIISCDLDDYSIIFNLHLNKGKYNGLSNAIVVYEGATKLDEVEFNFDSKDYQLDITEQVKRRMNAYIEGRTIEKLVLDFTCKIPYSQNTTYNGYTVTTTSPEDNYIRVASNDSKVLSLVPHITTNYISSKINQKESPTFDLNTNRCGSSQINLVDQEFKHIIPLCNIKSKKLNLGLKLLYDSSLLTSSNNLNKVEGLPLGWKLNLFSYLKKQNDYNKILGCKDIEYIDGEGISHILREKWYYKYEGKRHYIPKEKIYIDNDQKIKYYNEELNKVFNVAYEVSSDEGLNYFSTNSQLNIIKKSDLQVKNRYYIKLGKYGEKTEVELDRDGKIIIPLYFDMSEVNVTVTDFDEIKDDNFIKSVKLSTFKHPLAVDLNSNLHIRKQPCEFVIDSNGNYQVICYLGWYLIFDSAGNKTFVYLNPVTIPLEIEQEYDVNRSNPIVDYYENEDISNINNQISQIKSTINDYKKQLLLYSSNIANIKNEQANQKNILTLQSMVNNERKKTETDDNALYYTAIDTQAAYSLIKGIKSYEEQLKSVYSNYYDIYNKITMLETTLKNLVETKSHLVDEQKQNIQDYIIDKEGNILGFDYYGKLIYITDANENEIKINYVDNRIVSVESKTEKVILHYNNDKLLDYIINPLGIKIDIDYSNISQDEQNLVYQVGKISLNLNTNEKTEIKFKYTSGFRISEISDSLGFVTNYTWLNYKLVGFNQTTLLKKVTDKEILFNDTPRILSNYTLNKINNYKVEIANETDNTCITYHLDYSRRIVQIDSYDYHNINRASHIYYNYEEEPLIQQFEYIEYDHIFATETGSGYNTLLYNKTFNATNDVNLPIPLFKNKEFIIFNIDLESVDESLLKNNSIKFSALILDKNNNEIKYEYTCKKTRPRILSFGVPVYNTDLQLELKIESRNPINLDQVGLVNAYFASGNHFTYNSDKLLIKQENEEKTLEYLEFVNDKPTKIISTDKVGNIKQFFKFYNSVDKLVYEEDEQENVTEYYYDEQGNLIETIAYNKKDPSLKTSQKVARDELGNIISYEGIMKTEDNKYPDTINTYLPNTSFVSSITYPNGSTICYNRDFVTNKITEVSTDADGLNNSSIRKYRYGLLTKLKTNNYNIEYEYDEEERISKIKIGDTDYLTNTYTKNDVTNEQTITTTFNNNKYETVKYDKYNKAINITDSESNNINFTYNTKDQLLSKVNGTERITNTYNMHNLISSSKYKNSEDEIIQTFTYDDKHRLSTISVDVNDEGEYYNSIDYKDDLVSEIIYESPSHAYQKTLKYDALGRLISYQLDNMEIILMEEEYEYLKYKENTFNYVKNHNVKVNDTLVDTTEYQYDVSGNIIKIINDDNEISYEYDKLNRIVRENNPVINKTITYKYDTNGNIVLKKEYPYTLDKTLTNGIKKLYTYSSTNWKDKLINYNGKQIRYDNIGRMTKYGSDEISYYKKGLISTYNLVQYTYDINNKRISKEKNGIKTKYYYVNDKLVKETSSQKEIKYCYLLDKLTGFEYNGNRYLYQKNIQGDIIKIYNEETQELEAEYNYDAWGNVLVTNYTSENIGNINPIRYRGYYYDEETKVYYCNSRYYSPELCRWISPDSIEYLDPESINGLNLYCYCGNDPVNRFDPTGHAWDVVLDIGFIIWDIYNLCTNEGWKDWKNWAALGVDVAFAVVPFLTGGGGQIVKLANVADDVSDFKKITVVGETMTRVQTISQFVNATDNLYDGFKAYDRLSDLGKGGKVLAEVAGKADNVAWLYGKLRKGYTVIDIGIDIGRTARSSSYFFERLLLNIWKYRNIWKLPYHIF